MGKRVIKFRAWHNQICEMLYAPNEWDSSIYARNSRNNHIEINIDDRDIFYPAYMTWDGRQYINGKYQDVIWMQFTGINDKNGNEVYEGDIVETSYGKKGVVVYDDARACFILHDSQHFNVQLFQELPSIMIIGNIYENPELLTNEQTD